MKINDMPDSIYTKPDNHTPSAGTYCDVDDGGTKYIRAKAIEEMKVRMFNECDESYNKAIEDILNK